MSPPPPPSLPPGLGAPRLRVLRTGPLATVQDLGRPGLAALGVPRSGAADRAGLRLANRLVGNPEAAAAVEITMGGFEAVAGGRLTLALAGAPADLLVDGRAVGPYRAVTVEDGARLVVRTPEQGVRSYLAVRGGLRTPVVLGSRSTDLLSGIGSALIAGADLPIGALLAGPPISAGPVPPADLPPADLPPADLAPVTAPPAAGVGRSAGPAGAAVVLRVLLGPRDDWFTADAVLALRESPWLVTDRSNRVGARLAGPVLHRTRPQELPSEAAVPGALQVPISGQPVLLLADHPVTGGYPVIAVVVTADLDRAAQARPGQYLRFQVVPAG
jgi:biotin-dependent carboxylase-like uncharacterized protein